MSHRFPRSNTGLVRVIGVSQWQGLLNRVGPVLGLLLVIGIFSLLMDTPARFLSPNNLRIVLSQTVIVAIGAIGMTLIIISGGIDLAVGSTIALTGVVTALAINAGFSPTLALAAGIAVGGLVGVVNGLVITRLKVVPFIATLGMLGVARGIGTRQQDFVVEDVEAIVLHGPHIEVAHRDEAFQLLLTFALVLMFQDVLRYFWGANPQTLGNLVMEYGKVTVGAVQVPTTRPSTVAVARSIPPPGWTRRAWSAATANERSFQPSM